MTSDKKQELCFFALLARFQSVLSRKYLKTLANQIKGHNKIATEIMIN